MPTVNQQHFVFFANASATIGAGHVMRLLSLAQACLKRGIQVTFASYECPNFLREKLRHEGFTIVTVPAKFTLDHLLALKASAFVIDDYYLSDEQWAYFKNTKALLVNIDDEVNNKALISNIIINPAATANKIAYKQRAPQATLCLGAKFTLLRSEFTEQHFVELQNRKRILITLGGADVKNMSLALTQSLVAKPLGDAEIYVLLGGLNSQAVAPLQALASQHSNFFIIEQSQQVAALMMHSGLAISAAGGTLGELACMGTPSIALVSVDNQKAALVPLNPDSWFIAHDVRGFSEDESSPSNAMQNTLNTQIIEKITAQAHELWRDLCKRKHMSTQARQLIDGYGCDRIVEQILLSL